MPESGSKCVRFRARSQAQSRAYSDEIVFPDLLDDFPEMVFGLVQVFKKFGLNPLVAGRCDFVLAGINRFRKVDSDVCDKGRGSNATHFSSLRRTSVPLAYGADDRTFLRSGLEGTAIAAFPLSSTVPQLRLRSS